MFSYVKVFLIDKTNKQNKKKKKKKKKKKHNCKLIDKNKKSISMHITLLFVSYVYAKFTFYSVYNLKAFRLL